MSNKFFVFDDVLTQQEHEDLYAHLKTVKWTSQWSSTTGRGDGKYQHAWHWNYTFYRSMQNMPAITEEE